MAEYFPHDYDAREDEKIQHLLYKLGWKGYGLYWAIIEMLYSNGGYMQMECERIAYALRTDSATIAEIINDFGLFMVSDGEFTSNSVLERLKLREEKSTKARESANKRWNNANAMRTQCDGNAKKERKEKKIKEDEDAAASIWKNFWNKEVRLVYGEHLIRRHPQSKIFIAPFPPMNTTGKQHDVWIKDWQKKLEPLNNRLKEINSK